MFVVLRTEKELSDITFGKAGMAETVEIRNGTAKVNN